MIYDVKVRRVYLVRVIQMMSKSHPHIMTQLSDAGIEPSHNEKEREELIVERFYLDGYVDPVTVRLVSGLTDYSDCPNILVRSKSGPVRLYFTGHPSGNPEGEIVGELVDKCPYIVIKDSADFEYKEGYGWHLHEGHREIDPMHQCCLCNLLVNCPVTYPQL